MKIEMLSPCKTSQVCQQVDAGRRLENIIEVQGGDPLDSVCPRQQ
jgi:hypothetical protein